MTRFLIYPTIYLALIEAYEEILADALARQANRFQHEWSDFLYRLLEEEWRVWLCR